MITDWRSWAYDKLSNDGAVTALVPATSIFGPGSLDGAPADKPFIVIRFGPTVRGPFVGTSQTELQVWAHDDPGDFLRIQSILEAVQAALEGPVALEGAHSARWQGESPDSADDALGTITRWASYNLVGMTQEET